MTGQLAHRGPDADGAWVDQDSGVGLGHRRLAIVDLSSAGQQPMFSRDGRWVLAFNGEIYNHAVLRDKLERELKGSAGPWRGHSDTETLVECISAWGLPRALAECVGMFAIAVWDRKQQHLHLARDRLGEKPLYYGWVGGEFAFASELKALRALPAFDNPVEHRALDLFARCGFVPAPHSIFKGIFKLEPGCVLSASADQLREARVSPPEPGGPLVERYWSYREAVIEGLHDPISDEREAIDSIEAALLQAVQAQAVADVPVGAFLSGGIDSSAVVAAYRQHGPVDTFTIGFEESDFDESIYARRIADHLGTRHHELRMTPRDAQDVIPLLPSIYDEPFADSSQIPTYLVSRFARNSVTVALSGDGGDELFGGYNRYLGAPRLWSLASRIPKPIRASLGGTLGAIPPATWTAAANLLGGGRRHPSFGTKVSKTFRSLARADEIDDLHDSFVDEWYEEGSPLAFPTDYAPLRPEPIPVASHAAQMMYRDATSYLPDDILCKVDRAAMAVGLETRLPLLDHRVVKLAARIPLHMKISDGVGKQILRKLLFRRVPAHLLARPKAGFAVPVGEWLRGPLQMWAEDLLNERRLRENGFRADLVRTRWRKHLARQTDSTAALWHILMYQAWRQR